MIKQIFTDNRINDYAQKIHQMNVDKGFWPENRDVQQITLLNISEISEALESYRKGEQAIFEIDGKPEGWIVELADTAIRILDAIGGIDKINFATNCSDSVLQSLYNLTEMSIKAASNSIGKKTEQVFTDGKDNFLLNLKAMILYLDVEFEERGFNLIQVIEQKLAYNATRAHKHGKQF